MKLENPHIPEGINTQNEHPLKELFILLASIIGIVAVCLLLLNLFISSVSQLIPFKYEEKLANKIVHSLDPVTSAIDNFSSKEEQLRHETITHYLQDLGDQLANKMELHEDITITVHYSDSDVENAFATLGGHVFMYKGLLRQLPHENAIVTVLAHEIAHIKHRHPIVAMGQGIVLMTALAALAGVSDTQVATAVGGMSNLGSLSFSRKQETESDLSGLHAVAKHYGHVQGSDALFNLFAEIIAEDGGASPEMLSTHPNSEDRASRISDWAKKYNWQQTGKLTPVPDNISRYLNE